MSSIQFPLYFHENTSYSILYVNQEKVIIYANPKSCETLGVVESDLIGKTMDFFRSERQNNTFYEDMWTSVEATGWWEGEVWNRRANGELYLARRTIVKNESATDKTVTYIIFGRDITREKENETKVYEYAYKDPITALPIRQVFDEVFQNALSLAKKQRKKLALLVVDIYQFRQINIAFGFAAADHLLQDVAKRLQQFAGEDASLTRIGGDMFLILLPIFTKEEEAIRHVERVAHAFTQPFAIEGQNKRLQLHMGVSVYPRNGQTQQELFAKADIARYRAKENHVDSYQFYSSDLNVVALQKLSLETRLRQAIAEREFVLHYQPQVHVETNLITGVEALIRWQHPTLGLLSPAKFIPVAEETGLIVPMGLWVMEEVCHQIAKWQAQGRKLSIAMNLSAQQFHDPTLLTHLQELIEQTNIDPSLLEIEITESMMITDIDQTIAILNEMKALGVYISIDDFGTGYSSLGYLAKLPIDFFKIDRSFMNHQDTKQVNATITSSIIALAKQLGMDVVAEGVETKEQVAFLQQEKCDYLQGYYISPPLPLEKMETFIAEYNNEQ